MNTKKRIVVIGATSAIAHQCARIWAAQDSVDFVLVGRNKDRLDRAAADLRARSAASKASVIVCDLIDPVAIQSRVGEICASGLLDIVLIAQGSLGSQMESQLSAAYCHAELQINAVSPVLWAEAFAQCMDEAGQGTLAMIGSVSGDRGRKSNYVYGAAKGLVARYAQGLQHRFAGSNVNIVLVKPGPTDTPMTADLKARGGKLASVEAVAQRICLGIARGESTVYAPAKWKLIMLIIQHLPSFVFNKLNI